MEKRCSSEAVGSIPISKVGEYFSEGGFSSEDLVMSPLLKFETLVGSPKVFDGVTIGILCNGTAKTVINGRRFDLKSNSIFLLREDSVIESFRCSKACMGYLLVYSRSFLNMININTSDYLSAYMLFSTHPCIDIDRRNVDMLHRIAAIMSEMQLDYDNAYGKKVVASLFSAFFYMMISVISTKVHSHENNLNKTKGDKLLANFFDILGDKCERERSVDYYASQLGIKPKYLSLVCKKRTGRNASKIIDEAVIHRAKEMLKMSGHSIQDISDKLNFVSQSFFGKYFKQRVGISPSRYKVMTSL